MKNKILVIEDTSVVREEICDILKMEGFGVFEATNGEEGVKIAKSTHLNLIISDIIMPGMDGFEVFETLSKDNITNKIPVIFLSAKANKEAVLKGKQLGCKDYIIKPVSPDVLLNIVYNKINV